MFDCLLLFDQTCHKKVEDLIDFPLHCFDAVKYDPRNKDSFLRKARTKDLRSYFVNSEKKKNPAGQDFVEY